MTQHYQHGEQPAHIKRWKRKQLKHAHNRRQAVSSLNEIRANLPAEQSVQLSAVARFIEENL